MQATNCLVAWVEDHGLEGVEAAFLGIDAPERAPATRRLRSAEAARQWVCDEAGVMGLRVHWVDAHPVREDAG
jgi:hypothetical protein